MHQLSEEDFQDFQQLIQFSDRLLDQVLPQAGGIVLDIGDANDLAILLTHLKEKYSNDQVT
jgi:hypothetical protein